MNRTIKIPLYLTQDQKTAFKETSLRYGHVFNYVSDYGFKNNETNGVQLHKNTYSFFANRNFLPSQLICSARVKATEALTSFKTKSKERNEKIAWQQARIKDGKKISKYHLLKPITCPKTLDLLSIRYDARSSSIDFGKCVISLSTVAGRIKIPFPVNDYYKQFLSGKVCSMDLVYNRFKKRFFVHIVLEFPDPIVPEPTQKSKILGVDLGINNLAVSSDGTFYLRPDLRNVSNKYSALRSRLQCKGTQSAKRHLKKLSGCENRFHKDVNHCISKQIVNSAKVQGYNVIALENLKHIRENSKLGRATRKRLHSWPFAQLQDFLGYKAQWAGIQVETVSARYTSQGCSRCGHVYKPQRKGNLFRCVSCGYQNHADLNASHNISKNFLLTVPDSLSIGTRTGTSGPCGPLVQQAYCNGLRSSYKPTTSVVGS
jgi:IS605 OrfB family transposase